MGGASKLLMLLSSPFPLLYPRPSALRLTRHPRITITALSSLPKRRPFSTSRPLLRFSINQSSGQIHTQTANVIRDDFHTDPSAFSPNLRPSHPWPEWSKLVENLRVNGYFDRQVGSGVVGLDGEDALSVFENLPQEFLQAVSACLAFGRHRTDLLGSLSRKDIEIVVGNGSPFLFKSGADSMRRMKSFLGSYQSTELEFNRATTVDLMRFLLSYAYSPPVSDGNNFQDGQLVESSVRNLLSELADASRAVQEFDLSSSAPQQFADGYGQTTRPLRQNIEMKKGDWICPKCSFMNFARNMKCLDCSEARPKRQLTGGEWECPQCDFFNYGKNVACLRCDCRRPGVVSFGTAESRTATGFNNESNLNMANIANSRTPFEQRLANAQYRGNSGNDGAREGGNFQSADGGSFGQSTGTPASQSLDRILGRVSPSEMNYNPPASSETNSASERSSFSSSTSPQFKPSEGNKSGYVPFVPLPTDMFSKPQKPIEGVSANNNASGTENSISGKLSDSLPLSEKPVDQTESQAEKEQAEKSERWSRKVSELHDVTDLTSAISDEDFPEIMPERKGENRFVVGKKKDRSLTSPLHKRRMAMEQTNTTDFVPFVPFPPGYFANKDKAPEMEVASSASATHAVPPKSEEHNAGLPDSRTTGNSPQSAEYWQTNRDNWNTSFSGKSVNESKVDHGYTGNATQRPDNLQISNGDGWNSGSWKENRSDASNTVSSWKDNRSDLSTPVGRSALQSDNTQNTKESWKSGFTGKSLEGSLVKEPDPLDMSEEAKAERFFRRAAQIKDISELSQIPDEDFPSIMPMRKGVNRFVVSKRKTPLERRLTSPQYRRNLPIVSSEPINKENNES